MKLKSLFIFNAVVSLLFGLAFVLLPVQALSLYGVTVDAPLKYVGQLYGSALLVFGLVTWLARDAGDSAARSAFILGMFVGSLVGFIISLINQLGGVANALGWLTVVIYLLFTVGYGYFQFLKPGDS